ncbi:hypothetical protein N658DRAFT_105643 [Parathielavia hyrcaniae]|uniref:Uncharacterized protein n=1 Tax=Parathielavia hyrcaniae TaxID=113614 RepID=A0AAN6Q3H8_9PEZI|nr:hypothetical protein N658DRAFT_105643 [Parathielavia hyrcaniae]
MALCCVHLFALPLRFLRVAFVVALLPLSSFLCIGIVGDCDQGMDREVGNPFRSWLRRWERCLAFAFRGWARMVLGYVGGGGYFMSTVTKSIVLFSELLEPSL